MQWKEKLRDVYSEAAPKVKSFLEKLRDVYSTAAPKVVRFFKWLRTGPNARAKTIVFIVVCIIVASYIHGMFDTADHSKRGRASQPQTSTVEPAAESAKKEDPVEEVTEPAEESEEPEAETAEPEEDSDAKEETSEEDDAAYVLYDAFIDSVKATGIVSEVEDYPVDGLWIFYVTDSWNFLSQAEKQSFTDSILSEIKSWAGGMFGIQAPTVAFETYNGAIVAQSNFSASAMVIKY